MNLLDLDDICNQLEFGLDTLKAINIAMTESGTVLSENVLYVTLNFLLGAHNSLRQAINLGIEQGK